MEGLHQGDGGGQIGEMVPGIRRVSGRFKIGKGRLKIIEEMEKPKNNVYELRRWVLVGVCRADGNKGEKKWDSCNSIIHIYLKVTDIWGLCS